MTTQPPPNPMWRRSKPVQSKDGKSVWLDLMVVADVAEHYRIFKVDPNPKPNPKPNQRSRR